MSDEKFEKVDPIEVTITECDRLNVKMALEDEEVDDPDLLNKEIAFHDRLGQTIKRTKVRTDDPLFDQKASARRSAVYAEHKLRAATGLIPEGFVAPDPTANHDPAPKPATGFVVTTNRRRRAATAAPAPAQTPAPPPAEARRKTKIHGKATIWDGWRA